MYDKPVETRIAEALLILSDASAMTWDYDPDTKRITNSENTWTYIVLLLEEEGQNIMQQPVLAQTWEEVKAAAAAENKVPMLIFDANDWMIGSINDILRDYDRIPNDIKPELQSAHVTVTLNDMTYWDARGFFAMNYFDWKV